MATVRDFKTEVQAKWWGGRKSGEMNDERSDFWKKLNHLGARNMHRQGMEPGVVPDIDATVELSKSELVDLRIELQNID